MYLLNIGIEPNIGIKLSKLVNATEGRLYVPLKEIFLKIQGIIILFSLKILTSKNEKLLLYSTSKVSKILECWLFI